MLTRGIGLVAFLPTSLVAVFVNLLIDKMLISLDIFKYSKISSSLRFVSISYSFQLVIWDVYIQFVVLTEVRIDKRIGCGCRLERADDYVFI